jgi:glycosyltransferase involved in cell wall biosynthesis
MKILTLGLDNSITDGQSDLTRRVLDYGTLVEKYTVIVPAAKNSQVDLSDKVRVLAVGGCCKFIKLIRIYNLAKKILQQENFDVISVQDIYYLALVAIILAKKNKVGLEVQAHGLEKLSGVRWLVAGYVLSAADAIRAVSQRLKKQLIVKFGVKEEKITVVPIYTELGIKSYELREKNINDKFVFLTVGRLVSVKNIGLQIEAMAELAKKYPKAELWIVGDGQEKENLKLKIENLELNEKIKLLGQKNNNKLTEIYEIADVFLLTSNQEGWGLAVIEAANHSLSIIMTDVGCAGEVIKNGESGLVIPVGDKKMLVAAMSKLARDSDLRKTLGERAHQAALTLPDKEETARLYRLSWRKAANKFK